MTPAQRKSVENGVWLCRNCAKTIDDAPEAFPLDTLAAWKSHAEIRAARDSSAAGDFVAILLTEIDNACRTLLQFARRWNQDDPIFDFSDFKKSALEQARYVGDRQIVYADEVAPKIVAVIVKAETLLGKEDEVIRKTRDEAWSGPTNYLSMQSLAHQLQHLRTALSLR